MPANLHFLDEILPLRDVDTLMVVGRKDRLLSDDVREFLPNAIAWEAWENMCTAGKATDSPKATHTYTGARPRKILAGILPEHCSRHNAPSRSFAIPSCIRSMGKRGPQGVLFALDDDEHALASAIALARALPSYTATSRKGERTVNVAFLGPDGVITDLDRPRIAARAARMAASWVDMPPDVLDTTRFVHIARDVAQELGCHLQVIQGRNLVDQGLGGVWGVGKGAEKPPALVVLDHDPPGAEHRETWVGKGIVYDTGGLSIKSKTGMVGMKTDMGGAAAILAAFWGAVKLDCPHRLTAVLCIAENAVGPGALRPDDVITMLSGKTVEINNTDAEGRLVVADGLAWAVKYREPDRLVDLCTLTGAQATATGKKHGALYCNDPDLEQLALRAGRVSGDTVHALPYVPEFYRKEFASKVADMRNSVKDRRNAQASCAGQFLGNHLGDYQGPWLHVDMAAPAVSNKRGTGFGVGLLLTLAGVGAAT